MNTRRNFLKKAGLGMAALQLKPTELLAVNSTPLLFDFVYIIAANKKYSMPFFQHDMTSANQPLGANQ